MPGSKASRHPLIVRLTEVARQLRKNGQQDRRDMRATSKDHPVVRALYFDSASQHFAAADLILDAIKRFPLSATDCAGAVRSPSPGTKKGARS